MLPRTSIWRWSAAIPLFDSRECRATFLFFLMRIISNPSRRTGSPFTAEIWIGLGSGSRTRSRRTQLEGQQSSGGKRRTEESRVGKGGGSTCRSRWAQEHEKKQQKKTERKG